MRYREIVKALGVVLFALAGPVLGQQLESDHGDAANSDVPASTPVGSGPYAAVMEPVPGLPSHTLYRPATKVGQLKLPVVVWGNGACWNAGNAFRWFLSDIASYGYLVIAVGPIVKRRLPLEPYSMVPLAPTTGMPPAGALPPSETHSAQLLEAIDWAVAENARAGSPWRNRLDVKRIAVMGQSCGGAQALEVSTDPRVSTTVLWNSGLFAEPTTMGGGKPMGRGDLRSLHAPVAFISGDEEDLAFENANANFELISRVPALRAYARGVLHSGTYGERNGGEFAGVAVAWLDWQLKGDSRARRLFVGKDCGLCVNPHWVVKSKRLE